MMQSQRPAQSGSVAQRSVLTGQEESARDLREMHPGDDQSAAWQAYWLGQGYPWRTEPEIDHERQGLLAARRTLMPDPQHGIYPFKGMKLNRADIEWLLATHERDAGPVDWKDQAQQRRQGLDLRGAVLSGGSGQSTNLRGLPLARLQGGLARKEWSGWTRTSQELLDQGAVNLEAADLFDTRLEGACLTAARLNQADLRLAGLEGANLVGAQLKEANLTGAHLEGANLTGAQLEKAYLTGAELENANLHRAHLVQAILFGAQLKEANLTGAHLEGANLTGARLEGANLRRARLGRAILSGTLEGIDLAEAILADENGIGPRLSAVQWGKVDLSTVDWSQIRQLDDEYVAYQEKNERGERKDALVRLHAFKKAVGAYRRLALALRAQGLYEEAAVFSYRAHVLLREVLRRQIGIQLKAEKQGRHDRVSSSWIRKTSLYLCSLFLALTTGYGYKPWRSVITYLLIVITFASAYAAFDHIALLPNALVLSLGGFHGGGFFAVRSAEGRTGILLALEAVAGLLVEICYVIVFAKRFLEQ